MRTHDYGAVLLPEEMPYGAELGYFSVGVLADHELANPLLTVAGYPADKEPPFSLWSHVRRVIDVTSETLAYDVDTAGGQSGAPAWIEWKTEPVVVGIHTNGSATNNSATRITNSVMASMDLWLQEARR
ncbi:hypothetical protein GCM10010841_28110 [Deinococcus aerophilus]|uniref:Serine protease n=2 Tax=Deinococcus aerophilus TaxID=522488 RepID=A0ABQ2GYM5_9DEIO|nr:hypothetical protein GCM10010841_28110 [Deinococcus aerophilus]